MTNTTPTPSAKEQVLAWVRSKNPQTMKVEFGTKIQPYNSYGFYRFIGGDWLSWHDQDGRFQELDKIGGMDSHDYQILGSDMGLAELIIAINRIPQHHGELEWDDGEPVFRIYRDECDNISHYVVFEHFFDLTKNLHQQPDEFFESILPLIP